MSYNSTHTALIVIAAICLMAMYTGTALSEVSPIIIAIGGYAGLRELKRVQSNEEVEGIRSLEPIS